MLHKSAKSRLLEDINKDGFMAIFEALATESEELGNEVGQCCMPYIEEGDEFKEGEWVPELWFVVRKVLHEDDN